MLKRIAAMFSFAALALASALPAVAEGQRALPGPVGDADFRDGGQPDPAKVALGRLLFFDKVLSGNRNIACATCHHPLAATGDGLSLPTGEGAAGLGVTRDTGAGADAIEVRVPRNSPALFNLGAAEFRVMFHDGRVAETPDGIASPADDALPPGLDSVLAVQAMFPVTSDAEMAGQPGENAVADAAAAGDLPRVWALLADRLRAIPEYCALFHEAFDLTPEGISYVHVANAIAAFEAAFWRADQSPFDRYLRGEAEAMSPAAIAGMRLFYGKAGCAGCHAGRFQTDHGFHAIAMPQIGPGKGNGPSGREDFGRARVTGDPADRFAFRTPSLRNVALNGPYGHAGAYVTLEAAVRHHLDPLAHLHAYDAAQVVLPGRPDLDASDLAVMRDPALVAAIAAANALEPTVLDDGEVAQILDFLQALTDPRATDLSDNVPDRVPSGLPVLD